MQPTKPSKPILVLTAGSLGDALVTLPALQSLQSLGPVTVAGTLPYQLLGPSALGVHKVIQLDEVLQTGKTKDTFGEAFLFFKSGWEAATVNWTSGDTPYHAPNFMFDDFLCRPRPAHFYWNSVVEAAHPNNVFPDKPLLQNLSLLRVSGKKFLHGLGLASPLVIHPGSGSRAKTAPLDLFIDMAKTATQSGRKVLVVWGEAETLRHEELQKGFSGIQGVKILESPLSLLDMAGVLAESSLYAGCDSGVTHLASACEIPVFALFGPTDPQVWAPPGAQVYCADSGFRDAANALSAFKRWMESYKVKT
jgi:ADP-heptose:LPS heptosyltransferase